MAIGCDLCEDREHSQNFSFDRCIQGLDTASSFHQRLGLLYSRRDDAVEFTTNLNWCHMAHALMKTLRYAIFLAPELFKKHFPVYEVDHPVGSSMKNHDSLSAHQITDLLDLFRGFMMKASSV